MADIIAYVNHDLDDAIRAGLIRSNQIPDRIVGVLGDTHSGRIGAMVGDMIERSFDLGDIRLSEPVAESVMALRDWLFEHVYQVRTVHEDFEKASRILRELYLFFVANEGALVEHGGRRLPGDGIEVSVTDFVAGMTYRYAINLYHKLFLPKPWKSL